MSIEKQYIRKLLSEAEEKTEDYYLEQIKKKGKDFNLATVPIAYRTGKVGEEALKANGINLKVIKPTMQTSDLIWIAIKSDPYAIIWARKSLITQEMVNYVVDKCSLTLLGSALFEIPPKFITKDVFLKAISKDTAESNQDRTGLLDLSLAYLISKAPLKILSPDVIDAYINKYGLIEFLERAPESIVTLDQCKKALKENPDALQYIPDKFLKELGIDPDDKYATIKHAWDVPSDKQTVNYYLKALEKGNADVYDLVRAQTEFSDSDKKKVVEILSKDSDFEDGCDLAEFLGDSAEISDLTFCLAHTNINSFENDKTVVEVFSDINFLKQAVKTTAKALCVPNISIDEIIEPDQIEDYTVKLIKEFSNLKGSQNPIMKIISYAQGEHNRLLPDTFIDNIPFSWFTENLALILVKVKPEYLEDIPIRARTLKVCKSAVANNPKVRSMVPVRLRKDL